MTKTHGPLRLRLLYNLGMICDGITGLFCAPFGYYGTEYSVIMCEKIILHGIESRRQVRENLTSKQV